MDVGAASTAGAGAAAGSIGRETVWVFVAQAEALASSATRRA
jgi:hypothetical protein